MSPKLRFVSVDESAGGIPMEALGKQSFQDKGVTKLELGHEGSENEAGKIAQEYRRASARQKQEYAETASSLGEKKRDRRAPVRCVRLIAPRSEESGGARLRRGARDRATAPPVDSIELEIIRVLEAGNALRESPDYELHRLTAQTPAFFDETVSRHVEALEKEVATLEREAGELAKEIEELTGESALGSE